MTRIRFSYTKPHGDREHYLDANDVLVLLQRLPEELWLRLRAVHFNDRGFGGRTLGYVTCGHREIAICALPPRVSLSRACVAYQQSPTWFGARRGEQWPRLAVRRFLLYEVFLHELGHLQVIDATARNPRRMFASESKAEAFAGYWREHLWLTKFDHLDPAHDRPAAGELAPLAD